MPNLSRRRFAELLALSSTSALLPRVAFGLDDARIEDLGLTNAPLPPMPARPDESTWREVRARYLLPRTVAFLNAANLCPAPLPVVEALDKKTRDYESDPSPEFRTKLMHDGREEARTLLASALRASPEEIVITRNTSEGNNIVSSGLQLGPNDEVIVFSDSHPSNLRAWQEKSKRFGFTVVMVNHVTPHPGNEYYLDAFRKAITSRTKVLAFTHLTSNAGDLFAAREICAIAREHGVLTLLDGAQTFGAHDVDLSAIKPDFYTGSAHKWPTGPKECGVLFVTKDVHDRIWPSVYGLYAGAVGISTKLEALGQRDDARLVALAEAVRFRQSIGGAAIEARGRELALALMAGLKKLDGVTLWTDPAPDRSAQIVVAKIGSLDPRKLGAALSEKEKIVVTARGGQDRPGLRFSPHLYNTMDEIDRTVGAMKRYLAVGV
jgi:selenocysteine lyase/cysteine desulfurase